MSSIPLVALSVRPPNAIGDATGAMQLKALGQATQQQAALAPGQLQAQQQGLQAGQQESQLRNQAIQQGQFAVQDREAGMKAMQQWSGKDINEIPDLIQKNGGSLQAVLGAKKSAIEAQQQVINLNNAQLTQAKTKNDYLLGKLQAATDKSVPDEQLPQSIMDATNAAIKDGYLDPQHAQEVQQLVQQFQNPADLRSHLGLYEKGLMSQSEQFNQEQKNRDLDVKQQEANSKDWKDFPTLGVALNTRTGEVKTPAGQVMTPEQMSSKYVAIQQKQKLGQPITPEEKAFTGAYSQLKALVPTATFNMQQGALKGNALDAAAETYFQTGQAPTGMRSPALFSAVANRAAQLHPDGTNELAGNRVAYNANKNSYNNVASTLDTLSAFENSGLKNLKQFTDLANKLPDTGVPWLNSPIRTLDEKAVGAEYLPAINAAKEVGLREIARVTNDPKLSGSLTDAARGEVQGFIPKDATFNQIKHVVDVLTNDMANVHQSLAQQKKDIGARLGINSNSSQAGGAQQKNSSTSQDAGSSDSSGDPFAAFGGKKH